MSKVVVIKGLGIHTTRPIAFVNTLERICKEFAKPDKDGNPDFFFRYDIEEAEDAKT